MKDRLVTAGGALLALGFVYYLFFQPPGQVPITRPISIEPGRNGYLAIAQWLEGQGVRVASLRRRFDFLQMGDASFAETGNVLIVTLPTVHAIRLEERRSLQTWIARGNTLLVMATIDDTPEWATGPAANDFLDQLASLTGLQFRPGSFGDPSAAASGPQGRDAPARREAPIDRDTPVEFSAVGAHPLMEGVEVLRAYSDEPSELWEATPLDSSRLYLRLAIERSSGLDGIWQSPHELGQVILAGSGSLLTNHVVADTDAARLLANIVRYNLSADGTVIFDDMHQGLSVLYDAEAFFGDPRLHYSLWFLIAGWFVYLLGSSNRLAPPRSLNDGPRQGEFFNAVGGFIARRTDPRDAGVALLDEWFDEIRRVRELPGGDEPLWAALEATPTLGRRIYEDIRRDHSRLKSGRAVDLVRLHNTLRQARKAIG